MLTVKDLMTSSVQSSPDGNYWEPALPEPMWWRIRLHDALAVLVGDAVAIRQTTKDDITALRERLGEKT